MKKHQHRAVSWRVVGYRTPFLLIQKCRCGIERPWEEGQKPAAWPVDGLSVGVRPTWQDVETYVRLGVMQGLSAGGADSHNPSKG